MDDRDQERVLRPGREISHWPGIKAQHAQRTAAQLRASIGIYWSTLGTRAEISNGGRTVTVFAVAPSAPPTTEWSLQFGDAIHNYRSALDALAWALAHLDGHQPTQKAAKSIYFPFAVTRERWETLKRTSLASIPAFAQRRLEMVQPFHREPAAEGIGLLLNQLDVEDKHHEAIQISAVADDRASTAIHLGTRVGDGNPFEGSTFEWIGADGPVQNGAPLIRLTTAVEVVSAEMSFAPFAVRTSVGGNVKDPLNLLDLIDTQVRASFIAVMYGPHSSRWHEFTGEATSQ